MVMIVLVLHFLLFIDPVKHRETWQDCAGGTDCYVGKVVNGDKALSLFPC